MCHLQIGTVEIWHSFPMSFSSHFMPRISSTMLSKSSESKLFCLCPHAGSFPSLSQLLSLGWVGQSVPWGWRDVPDCMLRWASPSCPGISGKGRHISGSQGKKPSRARPLVLEGPLFLVGPQSAWYPLVGTGISGPAEKENLSRGHHC